MTPTSKPRWHKCKNDRQVDSHDMNRRRCLWDHLLQTKHGFDDAQWRCSTVLNISHHGFQLATHKGIFETPILKIMYILVDNVRISCWPLSAISWSWSQPYLLFSSISTGTWPASLFLLWWWWLGCEMFAVGALPATYGGFTVVLVAAAFRILTDWVSGC